MKYVLVDSSIDSTCPRKDSVILKIWPKKLSKQKNKRKKKWYFKKCGTYSWLGSQRSIKIEGYKRNVLSGSG